MSPSDPLLDALLTHADDDLMQSEEAGELLASLAAALPPVVPTASARARLFAAVAAAPHAPLAPALASLFERSVEAARSFLQRLTEPEAWEVMVPDAVWLMHFEPAPALAGADVGFVRVTPNLDFPTHTHGGEERNLVLAGELHDLDTDRVWRAGHRFDLPPGSHHRFRSGPEGVTFAVVVWDVAFDG